MSTTGNEFEQPGVNYPDRRDESVSPGADEALRSDAGVGGAIAQGADTLDPAQEQRTPALAQNDASTVDKVAGIVVQTRADVGTEGVERVTEVLRQRLNDAEIDLPDAEIEDLAHQVVEGS